MKLAKPHSVLAGFVLLAAALSINSPPAFAARIYNFLPDEARIMPWVDLWDEITLPANPTGWDTGCCRSDSLGWIATQVSVQSPSGHFVCSFNWWTRTEIAGGNYLTVGQEGHKVICTLCNADHQAVETSSGESQYLADRNSYTGC